MLKKMCSFVVVLILVLSLFTSYAFAEGSNAGDGLGSIGTRSVSLSYYQFATHYGYYEIPYGTVVGYGNTTSGRYVQGTQAALAHIHDEFGISCDPHGVDGLFGSNTYNAIYNFQVYKGLTADGCAGDNTFMAIQLMM